MNRIGNLYQQIISVENLNFADERARKGKKRQYGVRAHDKNRGQNILALHRALKDKTYKTSEYQRFIIYEPKEREIFRLPYFPDRITHHAIMSILEDVFTSIFTADTYSCIRGKGIHAAFKAVTRALSDKPGTEYCLLF